MNRETKGAVLAEIVKDFESCDTMFVADYRGLDMPGITELRDKLRAHDAQFRIVKNTLARKAAVQTGREELTDMFAGPTAIAFARGEAAGVAKVLHDAGKTTNLLELRGGLMDGLRVEAEQVKEIASLPSREVILSMLVSAINAPMTQTVGVLSAPMRDIVTLLDAYIEKRQKEEAAA